MGMSHVDIGRASYRGGGGGDGIPLQQNSIPLIGPQCKSDSQKGYPSGLHAAWERTHPPSHTLPLTMVYQPHG